MSFVYIDKYQGTHAQALRVCCLWERTPLDGAVLLQCKPRASKQAAWNHEHRTDFASLVIRTELKAKIPVAEAVLADKAIENQKENLQVVGSC